MIELKDLLWLKTLAKSRTMVEAAEKLHVTQSAISHRMKELENHFEAPIFIRRTQPVEFTEIGNRLINLAEIILPQVDSVMSEIGRMANQNDETQKEIRILIECHSCFNWLLPVLRDYQMENNAHSADIVSESKFNSLEALADRRVDLVITSDRLPISGIEYLPLFRFENKLAMPAAHALSKKEYIEPEDLIEETLLTYPVQPEKLDVFTKFLLPANIRPAQIKTAEMTLTILQKVIAGLGVTALPAWVLEEYKPIANFSVCRISAEGIFANLYAALRTGDKDLPEYDRLLQKMNEKCFRDLREITAIPDETTIKE